MKIKGTTSSYCKITGVKISGFKAYIYLLITSTTPQVDPVSQTSNTCVFSFFAKDVNTSMTRVSNNNYWIDRCNNYDNNLNNVDINKHREIVLEIDITNKNNSDMKNNRWVRRLQLVLINNRTNEEAWISEQLELISKEIALPLIDSIKLIRTESELHLNFNLSYDVQEDFNYINNNIKAEVLVTSAYTNTILEKIPLSLMALANTNASQAIQITLNSYYTEPINIEIHIKNLREESMKVEKRFYNPELILSNITSFENNKGVLCKRATVIKSGKIKNITKIK